MTDVEAQATASGEAPKDEGASEAAKEAAAEEVEEITGYADSAMDSIIGRINDSMGEKIAATFLGHSEEEDEGGDLEVIWLLAALALSKLGVTLTVNLDFGAFQKVFGWTSEISVGAFIIHDVDMTVVRTVIGTGLMLVQPLCLMRMHLLAIEHQGKRPTWLPGNGLNPQGPNEWTLSPLCIVLWLLFVLGFLPTAALSMHEAAGFIFLFFGIPAMYFTAVRFFRRNTWAYVDLRFADVVKRRQYENICMKEGSFLLFLFVASYTFVLNFLISYMPTWEDQNAGENTALFFGFMLYSTLPLYYLYRTIKDEEADRTFRLFREQLVSAFNDQNMNMKIVLLVEAALFSLFVVAIGGSPDGELACGFLLSLGFLAYTLYNRPFNDDIENYSDIIARGCSQVTLLVACIVSATDNTYGTEGILIVIALIGAAWFIYCLDFKDMFFKFLFLLIQLRAQRRAAHYTPDVIKKLSSKEVRRIAVSAIELHVLSALQKIQFATFRKTDFFHSDSLVSGLHELEISWLDLQQAGHSAVSLMELGFSQEELMLIPKQLDDMGDRSDIVALYERVLEERRKSCGDIAEETLRSMFDLAVLLRDMGEHPKAMQMLTECFSLQHAHLGAEHEDTLVSMQCLGEYHTFLKSAAKGTDLLRECVRVYTATDGPMGDKTLDAFRALGQNLDVVGMTKEATELLTYRLNAVLTVTHGMALRIDHPRTLSARLDLAKVLLAGGRVNAASELNLRVVLNRHKTVHGAHDEETLKMVDRYAEILDKMGVHSKALGYHLEAVEEKEATLGPFHSSTISSRFALAATLFELGRIVEVDNLQLEKYLAHQEEHLSPTHPTTVSSIVKLAALHLSMGKIDSALQLFERCHKIRCETLGPAHELSIGVRGNIANCYDTLDKMEEAIAIFKETIQLSEEHLGEASLVTLAQRLNYGQTLLRKSDFDGAFEQFSKTKEIATRVYGRHHPRAILALDSLGTLHMVKEQYQEALTVLEEGLALKAEVMDVTHPLFTTGLENIAISRQGLHMREESLQAYDSVLQIRMQNCGPDHESTIKIRASRVMPLAELGRQQEAMNEINHCLAVTTKALGPTHQRTIEYRALLCHVYCTLGQWDQAYYHADFAARETVARFGIDHFQSSSFVYKKAWILQQLGRHAEANELFASIGKEPHPMPQQQQQQQFLVGNPMFGGGQDQSAGADGAAGLAQAFAMMGALQQQQQQQQPNGQGQNAGSAGGAGLAQAFAMMGALQQQQQQPNGQPGAQQVQVGGGLGGLAQLVSIAQQMNAAQMQQMQQQQGQQNEEDK